MKGHVDKYDWTYKGEDTYKSFFGFICTFMVAGLMMAYTYQSVTKLVNRDDPDRSFYKLTKSRPKTDQLNLPEARGQMYIGLTQKTDFKDGTTISSFIEIDPSILNVRIDYYEKRKLLARKPLQPCEEIEKSDFEEKVENTNGVTITDFQYMRCIPRDTFNLFNEADSTNSNQITLHFEQCGGKYEKIKEFKEVLAAQRDRAIALGADPADLPPLLDDWQWTDPFCDPAVENCELPGLQDTPA